jgi:hypothetical protein
MPNQDGCAFTVARAVSGSGAQSVRVVLAQQQLQGSR